jgi:glycosyltransferase involved in cell wall biosynthesis
MRVTLVTETYFPQVNGVSRTLRELARCFGESGDEVQLICPDYGTHVEEQNVYPVPSIALPFYKELHLPRPPFGRVHRAVAAFRPDIIHIATEATLGWSLLRYAHMRGLPVVSSFHTNFDQYSGHYGVGWAKGMIWRYLRWFHNSTRETYVPSNTTIHELELMGFERLALWRRGVDSEVFRPDRPGRNKVRRALGFKADDVVITYVSRIAPEKNVDYLAQALAIVAAERPEVRILFVGDGPSRGVLQRRIGAIAHFAGYRRGDDLADHYAAGDLFAFSSLTETLGNVVLEAMSSGLPVVALRAGGVGETIESGSNGILVEPGEPPERFAAAICWLIDQADERRRMAEAARAYAVTQSWEAIMAMLRRRYQNVIGKPVDLIQVESH